MTKSTLIIKIYCIIAVILSCFIEGFAADQKKKTPKSAFVIAQEEVYFANVPENPILTEFVEAFKEEMRELPDFEWEDQSLIEVRIEYKEPVDSTVEVDSYGTVHVGRNYTVSQEDLVRLFNVESVSRDIRIVISALQSPLSKVIIKHRGYYLCLMLTGVRSEIKRFKQIFTFKKMIYKYRKYKGLKFGDIPIKEIIYKTTGTMIVRPAQYDWEGGFYY